jgi:hypothetical protein
MRHPQDQETDWFMWGIELEDYLVVEIHDGPWLVLHWS